MPEPPNSLPRLETYSDRPAKLPWPIKWALLGTLTSAIACLVTLYFGARLLLGSPRIEASKELSTNDLFNLLKLIFAIIAGVGGVVALVIAYRRQKVLEQEIRLSSRTQVHSEQVAEINAHDAIERRVTDLYGQAVEQLGHAKAAVRLGGLYSLERLAQDHEAHRQTVVDVICAYLRMPFQLEASEVLADNSSETASAYTNDTLVQELQVRLAAQRLLARHLRAPAADDPSTQLAVYWNLMRVDLSRAHLIDIDFSGCTFTAADFSNAIFSQGRARFKACNFATDALFSDATFEVGAEFSDTYFSRGASFTGCRFKAQASYSGAQFQGNSGFNRACFERESFFEGTVFANTTWMRRTEFQADADFKGARFGEHFVLDNTQFHHNVSFTRAGFSGTAQFRATKFLGLAQFVETHFAGEATFRSAKFRRSPRFTLARFDSSVIFSQARFERKPDFARASAIAPNSNHSWPPSWQIDPQVPDGERGILTEHYQPGLYPN